MPPPPPKQQQQQPKKEALEDEDEVTELSLGARLAGEEEWVGAFRGWEGALVMGECFR